MSDHTDRTVIAELVKNAAETVHVALDRYGGVDLIDIRAFVVYGESPEPRPSKKGLSLKVDRILRSAVAIGTTTDSAWAGPLAPLGNLGAEFINYLRSRTVLGRMTGMRRIPFAVRVPRATAGASVSWIGQGRVTAVTKMDFELLSFKQSKIAGIVVLTEELARSADPAAEELVRNDLADAVAAFSDAEFLDPTRAEVTDVSPASITYGATEIPSSGDTAAAVETDMKALFAAVETNLISPFLVMRPTTALYLATLRDSTGGDRLFPNVGATGGEIWGVPVLVSGNVPFDADSPSNTMIALIDAAEILLADDGVEFDATRNALVEMNTAPDSPPTASTTMTSLWQANLIGLKVTRFIRWQRRRDEAVAYISGFPA